MSYHNHHGHPPAFTRGGCGCGCNPVDIGSPLARRKLSRREENELEEEYQQVMKEIKEHGNTLALEHEGDTEPVDEDTKKEIQREIIGKLVVCLALIVAVCLVYIYFAYLRN
jgi:hypothetical protein